MKQPVSEVVITGIGAINPIGIGRQAFWDSLLSGTSGIQPIPADQLGTLPIPYAGQLPDFDPKKFVKPRKAIKMMSRGIQVGQAAATQAFEDAGLVSDQLDSDRFGVVFGSEMLYGHPSDLSDIFESSQEGNTASMQKWGEHFTHQMFPLWLLMYLPNMIACHAAIALDARGPNNTIVQGAASGLLAIIEAATYIERGWADVMISGGCGITFNPTKEVYLKHSSLSQQPDGTKACRPFDAHRDGTVPGEGGAAVILESRAHAEARGAEVLAAIVDFGRSVGLRDPDTGGATREAISRSIDRVTASAEPAQIQHVSAHGLGTVEDDRCEAQAIAKALGTDVPVTAFKSYFGCLGAGAGASEFAASVLALHHQRVPHILNFETPDPECPVAAVRHQPQENAQPQALVLSQSVTGQATAVLLNKDRS